MIPGIDPRVDDAFKKVFGTEENVPIVTAFLNAVLTPARRIVALELLNPFCEKDAADDKLAIVDIKARDELGQQYNVENADVRQHSPFESHTIPLGVTARRPIARRGQAHRSASDHFDCDRQHASVSWCGRFSSKFQLKDATHPEVIFSPPQEMHLLELPKFTKSAAESTDSLDAWCFFLTHAEKVDTEKLPTAFDDPAVKRAMEVLTMLSKNDVERERYRARQKWERDQAAFLDEALEEGRQEGREAGVWIGQISCCKKSSTCPSRRSRSWTSFLWSS